MNWLLVGVIAIIVLVVLYFILRLYMMYQDTHRHKSQDETDGMFLLVSDQKDSEKKEIETGIHHGNF